LVIDDNPVMRAGLMAMLRTVDEISDVVEAKSGEQALRTLASAGDAPFELVFLDVRLPGMDGLDVLARIKDVPVVMLTNADETDTIRQAMARGAKGYLVNGEFSEAELLAATHLCRSGGMMLSPTAAACVSDAGEQSSQRSGAAGRDRFGLTKRERVIVIALAEGLTNQQIAHRLSLSEKTVRNNLNRIYTRMGVASRGEALATWLRPE